jgi:hypothetical protein
MSPKPEAERGGAFEQQAKTARQGMIVQYFQFLREHSKWYLVPIILALIVLGALVFMAGSSVAPFVYTMF